MRRGFTVLELLVASLLLSMVVTILTMIFNQSSVAWRTGISSVDEMEDSRQQMGGYHDIMDDVLPGLADDASKQSDPQNQTVNYRTVSIFRNWSGSGQLKANDPSVSCQGRLFDRIDWSKADISPFSASDAMIGKTIVDIAQRKRGQRKGGYIVGVRSAGPNCQFEDEDDITTYPEDVE